MLEREGLQLDASCTESLARIRHDGRRRNPWTNGSTTRRTPGRGLQHHPPAHAVTDPTILVLDVKGRIVSWHGGEEVDMGYQPDEIIGAHLSVLASPEDVALGMPARSLRIAERSGWSEMTHRLVRKDSSTICANVGIAALRDRERRHTGFAVFIRTIEKHMEAMQIAQECAVLAERERLGDEIRHGAIHDMFQVSVRLQSMAVRLRGPLRDDVQQVIADIDGVIGGLRERIFDRPRRA